MSTRLTNNAPSRPCTAARIALTLASLMLCVSSAWANHDTDCTAAGGANGPGQLDCTLPDLVAPFGSALPRTTFFVYTPSTDQNPLTCAVGAMTVQPAASWLSIDTPVLDATADSMQTVEVSADPTGLAAGVYDGTVTIVLEPGPAPQCPSTGDLTGVVAVRLRIVETAPVIPTLGEVGLAGLALLLFGAGWLVVRRRRKTLV